MAKKAGKMPMAKKDMPMKGKHKMPGGMMMSDKEMMMAKPKKRGK